MKTASVYSNAPELQVMQWFNTPEPITLSDLRGKVVVIEAFQMLCPGCVSHGLPQAMRISETFSQDDVVVIGLHTVFEHHSAMQPHALEAFLHEYRIKFPVGVDQPSEMDGMALPNTMQTYQLRGTPSLLVIDRMGRQRLNLFGQENDMKLAASISKLIYEAPVAEETSNVRSIAGQVCTPIGCTN
ncbi:MAG: redoxin domain-containing protein [Litoreibacter sp.]|uniref:redoxin domain-containing protein n=1 Tax=Litoreibacter sp. TaxID=1969459 RepID=UPI00329683C1